MCFVGLILAFVFSVIQCLSISLGNFFVFQLQDATEYAECEAIVKDYPPFIEAMKKRGIHDMDLVMVDPWFVFADDDMLWKRPC